MDFPTVPTGKVLKEGGFIADEWRIFFDQMWTFFQINLSAEGVVLPSLTTAQIALLTTAQNGTMVYNSTPDKGMIRESGTFVNLV